MKPPPELARTDSSAEPRRGLELRSRALAVPLTASACAVIGVVIGSQIGESMANNDVIETGTSATMPNAVVGALGGGLGWLGGAIPAMVLCRHQPPVDPEDRRGLGIATVVVLCGALLLTGLVVVTQDSWGDPRMFRLHRLIWIDAGVAIVTLRLLAVRRWAQLSVIAVLIVIGVVAGLVAVTQFLPFIAECAPVQNGECRSDPWGTPFPSYRTSSFMMHVDARPHVDVTSSIGLASQVLTSGAT